MSDSLSLLEDLPRHSLSSLYNRSFLLTWEHDQSVIEAVLEIARTLRRLHQQGRSAVVFPSGLGYAVFRDKSTRTRYSFKAACNLLGLATEELDESTSQIAHGETVRETAVMISFLSEVIGIRDDMFLGRGHRYMQEVSAAIEESYQAGILPRRTAVINLQCDLDHPTQTLADLLHFAEYFGGLNHLKGKKLAMTWAYSPSYGKPLSVPQGIVALMTRFGMQVTLAHPPGYELLDEPLSAAQRFAEASGGSFIITHSLEEAFREADIVYPKSWAPLEIMKQRSQLLGRPEFSSDLKQLEQTALTQNAQYKSWECNKSLMDITRNGRALYAHCLPADISGVNCEHGEVSSEVFERYRLETYREASFKPFIIAALILLTRFPDPVKVLEKLCK